MLDLYVLETCPYCQKVLDYFEENKITYNKHDVTQLENYQKLLDLGGKAQVPFLVDDSNGTKLYESDDIIDYVNESL